MTAKTRRKSKIAAAAAAEADTETAESSQLTQAGSALFISIPPHFDLEFLDQTVPDVDDWTNPTPDVIAKVYLALVDHAKAHESAQENLERVQAELEKKDVELDQALQDREVASNDFEAALETSKREAEQAQKERDQLGTLQATHPFFASLIDLQVASQASLRAEIAILSTSQSSSSTELDSLRRLTEDTEREKRDLIGVISRLKQESTDQDGQFLLLHLAKLITGSMMLRGNPNLKSQPQGGSPGASNLRDSGSGAPFNGDLNQRELTCVYDINHV
jgi:nucleoprotein TPR